MHNEWLRKAAGAFKITKIAYIEKELCLEPIECHLERLATAFRSRSLAAKTTWCSQPHQGSLDFFLAKTSESVLKEAEKRLARFNEAQVDGMINGHPIQDWQNPRHRARAIDRYLKEASERSLAATWSSARRSDLDAGKMDRPVLREEWGKQSFDYYKTLSRAQSTALLQCRTGSIGLRKFLFESFNKGDFKVSPNFPRCARLLRRRW